MYFAPKKPFNLVVGVAALKGLEMAHGI